MKKCNITAPNGATYRRITKAMAKRLYNDGLTVIVCPSNLKPFTPWNVEQPFNINDNDENASDFDKRILFFTFYNCNSNEAGHYAAFYVKSKGGAR